MTSISKEPWEMTAAELMQRLFELNGIKQPEKSASSKEWDKYFQAVFLTIGMKIYGDKDKAQEFMTHHLAQFSRDPHNPSHTAA